MQILIVLFLIVIMFLALYVLFIMPRATLRPNMKPFERGFAHRGLFNNGDYKHTGGEILPENSLGAFKNAVAHGFGIELDIQLSSDGEVMVFHDYTLERMCGVKGSLSDHTAEELGKMRLLGTEYTIPTLKEVLRVVNKRVPLLIELKGETSDTRLCDAAALILDAYMGDYCVESFNPMLLQWFNNHRPDVARGVLVTDFSKVKTSKSKLINFMLTHLLTNVLSRPDFIALDGRSKISLSVWLCAVLFRTNVYFWTVRNERLYDKNKKDGDFSIFEGFVPRKY